jgi:hypothetical protein
MGVDSSHREVPEVRRALAFVCALVVWPTLTEAGCQTKNAAQVVQVLERGISLNERFKRSVNSGDEAAYRALRKQNEQYSEETALPCVHRAVELLDQEFDEALLRKLMEYTVSRQNSADETVSEAMATAYVRHPDAVAAGVTSFAPARAGILLRSIESGWSGVRKTLEPTVRQEREGQLEAMRTEQAKRAATK